MKYYAFKGSTPYCGTEFEAYVAVDDEVTEYETKGKPKYRQQEMSWVLKELNR